MNKSKIKGIQPFYDNPLPENETPYFEGNNPLNSKVNINWITLDKTEIKLYGSSLYNSEYSITLNKRIYNDIVYCFSQIMMIFTLHIRELLDNTSNWTEIPDILSFKLCSDKYDNFIVKLTELTHTKAMFNKVLIGKYKTYGMATREIVMKLFQNMLHDEEEQNGLDAFYYNHYEIDHISKNLFDYAILCFFFRIIVNKRILPYIRYLLQTNEYNEILLFTESICNNLKKMEELYSKLSDFEGYSLYTTSLNPITKYPFRKVRFHYSSDFYYSKIFGTKIRIPQVISIITKNPEIQYFREKTCFSLMIYGNPKASYGMMYESWLEIQKIQNEENNIQQLSYQN